MNGTSVHELPSTLKRSPKILAREEKATFTTATSWLKTQTTAYICYRALQVVFADLGLANNSFGLHFGIQAH